LIPPSDLICISREIENRIDVKKMRGMIAGISAIAALSAALAIAMACVYIAPPRTAPAADPDAVMVVGPVSAWRVHWALQLAGPASTLVLSVDDPAIHPECRVSWVVCFRADPYTTQGEARELRALVAEHGWRTVTVVTSTPHQVRTQLRMDWCVPHGVTVVSRPTGLGPGDWLWQYAYQTAGFVKGFLITPGC
jgi:hypothetical protein